MSEKEKNLNSLPITIIKMIYTKVDNMKITTERLTIRNMQIDDLFLVYSDKEAMKYIEPTFSLKQSKEFVAKYGLIANPLVYSIKLNDISKVIGHLIYHKAIFCQLYP